MLILDRHLKLDFQSYLDMLADVLIKLSLRSEITFAYFAVKNWFEALRLLSISKLLIL